MFNEVGPCEVVQLSDGTYGTQVNTWGWDRSSNILFIDQPNQVGFSYDTRTNASFDLLASQVYEPPTPPNPGLPRYMYLNGTFGTASFDDATPWADTANTTEIAAQATWHFLQAWLSAFPQYNPATRPNITTPNTNPNMPAGVNLFSESYGGKYGPVFATFFEQQNQGRLNGTLNAAKTLAINLETVGILNGKIDDLVQDYYYPLFAYNNTYDIQAINQVDELNDLNTYTNDCISQITQCRAAMATADPVGYGDDDSTNSLCMQAQITCNGILDDYMSAGYYPYDIRQKYPTPDPPAAYQQYLNNQTVLAAIGAQINYTETNFYVASGFLSTGDTIRGGMIEDLAALLSMGIRVALIYGDADYICNWYGGQAVSLAIAALVTDYPPPTVVPPGETPPPAYSIGFPSSGYAEIVTNSTYVGGAVRQFGNLSFSRIYDAGHFIPYFQPETAFTVFTRIIQGTDISTGEGIDLSTFGSTGPANATYANTATYSPSPTCWVRASNQSCSDDDTNEMLAGAGVVANGIFYSKKDDTSSGLPSTSVTAGVPYHPMTTGNGAALTGVYTATGTPKQSGRASAVRYPAAFDVRIGPISAVVVCFLFGFGVML